jgi:hypothetical protein
MKGKKMRVRSGVSAGGHDALANNSLSVSEPLVQTRRRRLDINLMHEKCSIV